MKCESGSCQFRSVAGLLASLLKLAKNWHTAEVKAGRLTDENWEEHYGRYVAERLTPYLTSLQAHVDNRPVSVTLNSFDYSTPEERGNGAYDARFHVPSPASVGAAYTGEIQSRYHVG